MQAWKNTEGTVCNITDASDDTSDDADKFDKDAKSKRATTSKQTEGPGPKHPRQAQELRSEKLTKGMATNSSTEEIVILARCLGGQNLGTQEQTRVATNSIMAGWT